MNLAGAHALRAAGEADKNQNAFGHQTSTVERKGA